MLAMVRTRAARWVGARASHAVRGGTGTTAFGLAWGAACDGVCAVFTHPLRNGQEGPYLYNRWGVRRQMLR
jgi:hypothetical protein